MQMESFQNPDFFAPGSSPILVMIHKQQKELRHENALKLNSVILHDFKALQKYYYGSTY